MEIENKMITLFIYVTQSNDVWEIKVGDITTQLGKVEFYKFQKSETAGVQVNT